MSVDNERSHAEYLQQRSILEENGQADLFNGGGVIFRTLNKFSMRAALVGDDIRELERELNEIIIHEAMIECDGVLSRAAKSIGMSLSAARKHLKISQKEWVRNYLGRNDD